MDYNNYNNNNNNNNNNNSNMRQSQWQNSPNVKSAQISGYEREADGSATLNGFNTPPQQSFLGEEMRGSIQRILADNVGEYVVIEFLIGTELLMRKQGLLYFVGTSYVTLYDDVVNNFIVCDIFSIKFVYFYFPGQRPKQNYNLLNGNQRNNM